MILLWLMSQSCIWLTISGNIIADVANSGELKISPSIDQTLQMAIKDLPSIKIMIRQNQHQQDAENIYIQWFLNKNTLARRIIRYDINNIDKVPKNRDHSVIVTTTFELENKVSNYVENSGTYFYIFDNDEIHLEDLHRIFHGMWQQRFVYKSFILLENGIFIYDPFEYDLVKKSYGKIVIYTGDAPLGQTLFYDMRGYPLRVQIFRSVYSKPIYDPKTKKLLTFEGTDWMAAQLLQEKINYTMMLQEPDPNYFG